MKVSENHFTGHNAYVAAVALGPAHGYWHFCLPALSGSCQSAIGNYFMPTAQGERWELNQPSRAGGAGLCYLVIPEVKEALHFGSMHYIIWDLIIWVVGKLALLYTVPLAFKQCFFFFFWKYQRKVEVLI